MPESPVLLNSISTIAPLKIYSSNVKVDKNNLTVIFPKEVVKYLKLQKNVIFWVPINGTIQLLSSDCQLHIPVLHIDESNFFKASNPH